MDGWRKISEFATDCGVSERQIRNHLKNHADELEGHVEKRPPNGTWIDQEGESIVKGYLRIDTVAIMDPATRAEIEELRNTVTTLQKKLIERDDLFIEANKLNIELQEKVQHLLEAPGKVSQEEYDAVRAERDVLAGKSDEAEKNADSLKKQLEEMKKELDSKNAELEKTAQDAKKEAMRAEEIAAERDTAVEVSNSLREKVEEYQNQGFWQRLFGRRNKNSGD